MVWAFIATVVSGKLCIDWVLTLALLATELSLTTSFNLFCSSSKVIFMKEPSIATTFVLNPIEENCSSLNFHWRDKKEPSKSDVVPFWGFDLSTMVTQELEFHFSVIFPQYFIFLTDCYLTKSKVILVLSVSSWMTLS
jgi:hypothetical protein